MLEGKALHFRGISHCIEPFLQVFCGVYLLLRCALSMSQFIQQLRQQTVDLIGGDGHRFIDCRALGRLWSSAAVQLARLWELRTDERCAQRSAQQLEEPLDRPWALQLEEPLDRPLALRLVGAVTAGASVEVGLEQVTSTVTMIETKSMANGLPVRKYTSESVILSVIDTCPA